MTMSCFLSKCCDVHWDKHFDILKKPKDITKYSGFISQMIPACCCMKKYLELLKRNCATLEGFASFMSRQNKHAGDDHNKNSTNYQINYLVMLLHC